MEEVEIALTGLLTGGLLALLFLYLFEWFCFAVRIEKSLRDRFNWLLFVLVRLNGAVRHDLLHLLGFFFGFLLVFLLPSTPALALVHRRFLLESVQNCYIAFTADRRRLAVGVLQLFIVFDDHAAICNAKELVGLDPQLFEYPCLFAFHDALLHGIEPLVVEGKLPESDMYCERLDMRLVVYCFHHEAVVVLVLGPADEVVVEVVDLHLVVLRAEQVIVLAVQLQRFPLPDLEVVAARVGLASFQVAESPLVLVLVVAHVPHEPHRANVAL